MADAAGRLTKLAEEVLGTPLPVRIRAWDRSESGPPGGPVLVIRHRRALRRLLFKPGELGLARGWVAGDLDIEGDLYEALDLLAGLLWERAATTKAPRAAALRALARPELRAAARELLALAG
ncbi:SAM-dependent methyltransferase, partial [Streptomyces lydicus]